MISGERLLREVSVEGVAYRRRSALKVLQARLKARQADLQHFYRQREAVAKGIEMSKADLLALEKDVVLLMRDLDRARSTVVDRQRQVEQTKQVINQARAAAGGHAEAAAASARHARSAAQADRRLASQVSTAMPIMSYGAMQTASRVRQGLYDGRSSALANMVSSIAAAQTARSQAKLAGKLGNQVSVLREATEERNLIQAKAHAQQARLMRHLVRDAQLDALDDLIGDAQSYAKLIKERFEDCLAACERWSLPARGLIAAHLLRQAAPAPVVDADAYWDELAEPVAFFAALVPGVHGGRVRKALAAGNIIVDKALRSPLIALSQAKRTDEARAAAKALDGVWHRHHGGVDVFLAFSPATFSAFIVADRELAHPEVIGTHGYCLMGLDSADMLSLSLVIASADDPSPRVAWATMSNTNFQHHFSRLELDPIVSNSFVPADAPFSVTIDSVKVGSMLQSALGVRSEGGKE